MMTAEGAVVSGEEAMMELNDWLVRKSVGMMLWNEKTGLVS